MLVFLNPGHAPNGNPDPGACSPITGLRESDVAADVAAKVSYYLNQVGIETTIVQDDSLAVICDTANAKNADLFVSIHCNSADNTAAKGTETFAYYSSDNGRKLASCIQKQIIDSLHTVDRGVKEAGYYVIKNTDMTAVLVELAFISNEEDEQLLSSEHGKDEFARAIARGITDYI
jgi:N-acetylmuramoyl-L-alanine amidase